MFKKKKTYVILVIIALIFGGYFYFKNKKPEVKYVTEEAKKGNLAKTVSATGEISPPEKIDISFKSGGQIETLSINVGDRVEKGQKIGTVDTGTLFSDLQSAEKDLAYQRDTLRNMQRRGNTYNYFQKEAQKEQIRAAQIAVGKVKKQIGETVLFSPVSGTVIKKNVEIGEAAIANAVTANTAVATIATDGDLLVEADIAESDIADVKLGQKVDVTLDALPAEEIIFGEVSEIDPASTVIQEVVYYKVKIKLNRQDERLKIGMSADIEIKIDEKKDVLMISGRSVKKENGNSFVEIISEEGKDPVKKEVKTGFSGDDGMVEVVSGLTGGEKVVVSLSEK